MTLVTSINISPGFALMTTDTRRIISAYWYDSRTNEYTRDEDGRVLSVLEEKIIKVRYLSRSVMMGSGGLSDLSAHLSKEMGKVARHGDDLLVCGKKLTKLIEKMRRHPNPPYFFSFLNQEYGVMVILNGFTRNGEVGMVYFESGPGAEVRVSITPPACTQYSMIPPDKIYMEHVSQLSNGVENGTEAYEAAVTLHAKISLREQVKVSPDCHHFILARDRSGQIKKLQGELDTTLLYEHVQDTSFF